LEVEPIAGEMVRGEQRFVPLEPVKIGPFFFQRAIGCAFKRTLHLIKKALHSQRISIFNQSIVLQQFILQKLKCCGTIKRICKEHNYVQRAMNCPMKRAHDVHQNRHTFHQKSPTFQSKELNLPSKEPNE